MDKQIAENDRKRKENTSATTEALPMKLDINSTGARADRSNKIPYPRYETYDANKANNALISVLFISTPSYSDQLPMTISDF